MSPFHAQSLVSASLEEQKTPPCVYVCFGATGDLMARKIAPALYNLARKGLLHEHSAVLGVARRDRSDEQWRNEMADAIGKHGDGELDGKFWGEFSQKWHYHVTHADEPAEYRTLSERLQKIDETHGTGGGRLFYLAMTPDTFPAIIKHIREHGINRPDGDDAFARIVVEKPFGHDLPSARRLNQLLLSAFDEQDIFRIDHYLGKETVQNLLVLRFANSVFEPLLNRQYVDNVQITAVEPVGMEGRRGPYYERTGALRDMIQNHMLQLLSLMAMDVPVRMDGQSIRSEKVRVLRSLVLPEPAEVARQTVRGQYLGGEDGPAYRDEDGVDANSQMETYAAVKLHLDNWRWAGVPFYLRTGKRLADKATYIVVTFRREPISLFYHEGCDLRGPDRMVIRIAPNEGASLIFDAKVPGTQMLLRPVRMDFDYSSSFASGSPEAYEHLVMDAAMGLTVLFVRDDEVEASWRFIDCIRSAWDNAGKPELKMYPPGGWGPEDDANRLFDDPYQRWYPLRELLEE